MGHYRLSTQYSFILITAEILVILDVAYSASPVVTVVMVSVVKYYNKHSSSSYLTRNTTEEQPAYPFTVQPNKRNLF